MIALLLLSLFQESPAAPAAQAPFGTDEVGVAAEVLGLSFSESELALMLPDVLERLKDFERLRARPLANDVAPVLYFAPDPGVLRNSVADERDRVVMSAAAVSRPADLEELAYKNIDELSVLISRRLVSCVELTQMYLARLKRLDEKLHCVVTLTEKRALEQARQMDLELAQGRNRGPLHGLPWVAKDLLAVKGYPTTWGTPPFRQQRFSYDAAVVQALDGAGAILIAKVSLGELAWGDVWFGGQTRNPWSLEEGSSGSSAGSASAVAAGCAAFAIGSETYGSIVSPSSVCGVSSLRPTFGRVSRFGAMTLCWSLDKLGPLARSALDASIVLDAIHGRDPRDPISVDMPFSFNSFKVEHWKVGVPQGAFEGPQGERCKTVLDELKALGVELVDVKLPDYPVDAMMIVLAAEAGAAFDDFSHGTQDDEMVRQERFAWPNTFRQAELIPAVDYIRANRLRAGLIRDLEQALVPVRAIVYPSFSNSLLATTNLTGHPTFVAPCGFDEQGKPYSISFTGKLFGEGSMMVLAQAWQGRTRYHQKHPEL